MTLIFAGHVRSKSFNTGLFAIGDSAITNPNGRTLLSGFKKVYPLPIKLWKPYFINDRYFKGYNSVYYESEGFIAFAGNTLSSQHYINAIGEHLGALRISCRRDGPFVLDVRWLCQDNPLFDSGVQWDDNLFELSQYRQLLTEGRVVETIQHALETAVRSAREYKIDEDSFRSLLNEFAIGFRDPQDSRKFCLYEFVLESANIDSVMQVKVSSRKVDKNELVVLGMKSEFAEQARTIFSQSPGDPERLIWEFTNKAIDTVKARGQSGIDKPVVWWRLDSNSQRLRLQLKSRSEEG